MHEFIEKRKILLPRGGILEVDITKKFIDGIRKHFMLLPDQEVNDDMIRMFVWGSMKPIVESAEKEFEQQGNK